MYVYLSCFDNNFHFHLFKRPFSEYNSYWPFFYLDDNKNNNNDIVVVIVIAFVMTLVFRLLALLSDITYDTGFYSYCQNDNQFIYVC